MKNKKIVIIGIALVCIVGIIALAGRGAAKSQSTEKSTAAESDSGSIEISEAPETLEVPESQTGESKETKSGDEANEKNVKETNASEAGSEEARTDTGTSLEQKQSDENNTSTAQGQSKEAGGSTGKKDSETPQTEESSIPGNVGDTGIQLVSIGAYEGTFVEDGSDDEVSGVAAIMIKNNSGKNIQYAELTFQVEGKSEALFTFSNIPAEASVMVFEQNRMSYEDTDRYVLTDQTVAYLDELPMMEDDVGMVIQDNNSITVTNLTDQDKKNVRLFYKYRYENGVYIGGITFTVKLDEIKAGKSITCSPSHFDSEGSEIVMVKEYDE